MRWHVILGSAIASLGVIAHMAVVAFAGFDDALVALDDDVSIAGAALRPAA